jgi:CSLREA domain-containing protein
LGVELLEARLAPAIITVNTLNDETSAVDGTISLREAIAAINAGADSGDVTHTGGNYGSSDTIQFSSGLTGTITLSGGELAITQSVQIIGPGSGQLTVSGNNASRIFDLTGTGLTVSVSGLTLATGSAGSGGAAQNLDASTTVSFNTCVFNNNQANTNSGGALSGQNFNVSNCTFTGNTAAFNGGAINATNLTVTACTFTNNQSNSDGGGLIASSGTAAIVNSTFYGNSGNNGGAIDSKGSAVFTITDCTFSNNTASNQGGAIAVSAGSVTLTNTIVAGNTAAGSGPDVSGTITSGGSNLVGNTSGSSGFGASGDILNQPPNLGPLTNNGGPTQTMALLFGSPAINAGNPSAAPATDQRGVARSGKTDIGAFEYPGKVVNTNDSGPGSLRQAILNVNADPGTAVDTIFFAIPGPGVHTIALTSALPAITHPVIIDGYSQPGAVANTSSSGDNAVLLIELNGTSAGINTNGLTIAAANCTVAGLVLNRFGGNGILLSGAGATGDVIQGNFIGTSTSGTTALSNAGAGVALLLGAGHGIIGGATAAARNLISANQSSSIQINGSGSNSIQGNIIGLDATGLQTANGSMGNQGDGIQLNNSSNNTVGGTSLLSLTNGLTEAGNVIGGNLGFGVDIKSASSLNVVAGNFIGVGIDGTSAADSTAVSLGNQSGGVAINASSGNTVGGQTRVSATQNTAFTGNVISNNGGFGVKIANSSTGNLVAGNFVGTAFDGTTARGNASDGILVLNSAQNTVGGVAGLNGAQGGTNPIVNGNFEAGNVGFTNAFSPTGLGSTQSYAVTTNPYPLNASATSYGDHTTGTGNMLALNGPSSAPATAWSETVTVIPGVNYTFSLWVSSWYPSNPATLNFDFNGTTIGSFTSPSTAGVWQNFSTNWNSGTNTSVTINIVDTNTNASGNDFALDDISLSANAVPPGNLISGNAGNGVDIVGSTAQQNSVQGNYIGTDVNGTNALPNATDGVRINTSSGNIIGGTGNSGNLLSGNLGRGITLTGAAGNTMSGSSSTATNNLILGNLLGTQINGTSTLGNGLEGIYVTNGANSNIIGGGPSTFVSIPNAGFETPVVGTNTYQFNPTGASWTFSPYVYGSSGVGIAGNGSAFTTDNPNAPEGTQVAFIQDAGTISQSLSFVGGTYTVSFFAARRGYDPGGLQTLQVLIDGSVIGTFTPSALSYVSFTTSTFTVSGGAHTLAFHGLTVNDSTALIDQVSVTSTPGAANTIAFNNGAGVLVGVDASHPAFPPTLDASGGAGNAILQNSIFSTGGIVLNGIGNNLQVAPVFTSVIPASLGGGTTTINFTLANTVSSATPNYRIEFFANDANDPEGKTYIGTVSLTGNGGTVSGQFTTTDPMAANPAFMTATATKFVSGNPTDTSEFSGAAGTFSDTFTRPDAPDLGAGWRIPPLPAKFLFAYRRQLAFGGFRLQNNAAVSWGTSFSAEQVTGLSSVNPTLTADVNAGNAQTIAAGLLARLQSNGDCYAAILTNTGVAEIVLLHAATNSLTILGSASAGTNTAMLQFLVNSSTLSLYLNGSTSPLVSVTDTTLATAGGVGIFAWGPNGIIDNFSVSDASPGSLSSHAVVAKNLSTGIDNTTGLKLANLAPDTNYVIGPGGTGGSIGVVPTAWTQNIANGYVADAASSSSAWITPGSPTNNYFMNVGTYYFQTVVDLTGFDAISAQITNFRYSADNQLMAIYLNNNVIYSNPTGASEEFHSFIDLGTLAQGQFQPGVNILRFEVYNGGLPMALRIEGTVTAVPT